MVNSKKGKTQKDAFFYVMLTQTIVCGIIIILIFISMKNNGWFVKVMADGYSEYSANSYESEDISDAFVALDSYAQAFASTVNENSQNDFAKGGKDIVFSSVEALEGVCLEEVELDFKMQEPLDDYKITSNFGYRVSPISGATGIHTGVDMAASYGSKIRAAADGEVLDAAWDNSYGYYVKIAHSDNVVSIYAHCSKLCVEAGEKVKAGEVVARVGSTGNSTGNHLHFEVRKDNIKINPEFLLFGNEKN